MSENKTKEIMRLLENKTFVTATNNWYAAIKEFKNRYPSVVRHEFMNTTSSAGDWDGFLIQRTGSRSAVAIPFWQENNYPNSGFTLRTGTAFMKGRMSNDFVECAAEDYAERVNRGYWD